VATGTGGGANRCSVDGLAIRGMTNRRHIEDDIWNEDFNHVLSFNRDSFMRSGIVKYSDNLAR
jgi:hypothetical protein